MRIYLNFKTILFILFFLPLSSIEVNGVSLPVKIYCNNSPKTLTGIDGIFQSIDHVTLQSIIQTQNANAANAFYNSFGMNVASYLESVYADNFLNEVEDTPEAMVVLGIFRWGKEHDVNPGNTESYAPDDDKYLGCFIGAVGSLVGISEITGLYNDFRHGVSPKTILRALKVMLKRVAAAWTIVSTVYGLGSCIGWW